MGHHFLIRRLRAAAGIAVGTLMLVASASAFAQTASLSYDYGAQAWTLGNNSQWVINAVSNGQSTTKVDGSVSATSYFEGDVQTAIGHAFGTASVYVDYGHLGASASALGQVGDIPTPPPNYGAIQSYAEGIATATTSYLDTLSVESSSLSAGTPVTISFLVTLDGSIKTSGSEGGHAFASVFADYSFDGVNGTLSPADDSGTGFSGKYVGSIDTYVGSTFAISADLRVAADAIGGNFYSAGGYSDIDIAFLHTEMNYFTINGDVDAQLLSASGHDYSQPSEVPEPSERLLWTLALVMCGAQFLRASKIFRR